MGRRHSRPAWYPPPPPRPPPPIKVIIPNFPFPPRILNYLLSQSQGFSISFSSPNGSSGSLSSTPIQNPNSYNLNIPAETTKPVITLPPPKDVPAYLTTLAPNAPQPTNPNGPPTQSKQSNVSLPGNVPPMWVAAIRAMEFVSNRGPIDSNTKLITIYNELAQNISAYMGDGGNSVQNASALVFFCTSIGRLFAPFQEKFLYNSLSMKFPNIFVNSDVYKQVVMINFFCNKLNRMFYSVPGNGYISKNDRVMLYAVPNILNEVIILLKGEDPIANML